MTFHFNKPAGFTFKPGQFADYTLINPPETDAVEDTRTFSLGAPYEEDELTEAQEANANFKLIASMTDMDGSKDWKGETGFFTKEMLEKYIGDLSQPIYYISGPPSMVTSIRKTLNEAGIDDDNIRTEEFSGYYWNESSECGKKRKRIPTVFYRRVCKEWSFYASHF